MGRPRTLRSLFEQYASAMAIMFGQVYGVVYAFLVYSDGSAGLARFGLGITFLSAGIVGFGSLEYIAVRKSRIPYGMEMQRIFFLILLFAGASYVLRQFGESAIASENIIAALSYYLTGAIAGTVLMMSAMTLLSLRYNVLVWDVVRFPVWIGSFVRWSYRGITGAGRRR